MSFRSKNEDRLSNLPEELLSYILSLMPTRFAVQTCILSKSWKYNWMLVTNLDFIDINPAPLIWIANLSNFIDRVLMLCKTSQVKLFRLRFPFCRALRRSESQSSMLKSNVSKWINEAVRLNVCELYVNAPRFELPLSLFTSKKLTKLSIVGRESFWQDFIFPSLVVLPCLKTLDITVPGRASPNAIFRLIRGCPVLEILSLVLIFRKRREDYNFDIPTLKRLELITHNGESINIAVLNLPNLKYLYVGGVLCSLFVIKDLSSLVQATVNYSHSEGKFNVLIADLLKGISGAKSLSLSAPSLDVVLKSPIPKFPNLKHLELKGSFSSSWLLVFQHLESSSKLEHLCFEEPKESCWIEPQSVPTWMLTNLRTMKITRCKGRDCDIRFIEYMLGNSEVLKTLTITCEGLFMDDEMRLHARLLTFPRASRDRYCQIHFVGKWLNSNGK